MNAERKQERTDHFLTAARIKYSKKGASEGGLSRTSIRIWFSFLLPSPWLNATMALILPVLAARNNKKSVCNKWQTYSSRERTGRGNEGAKGEKKEKKERKKETEEQESMKERKSGKERKKEQRRRKEREK